VLGHLINPAPQRPDPELERQARLTGKERRVIQAVVEGNGALNKTIAQRLCISEHTLRNHLTSIYQKLDVGNRLELYVYATKHGLGAGEVDSDVRA
jgi:DNA-binding NarL/FixJ family response regulator